MAWRPDEQGGARITWRCRGGCGGARPNLRVIYYCFPNMQTDEPDDNVARVTCASDNCTAAEIQRAAQGGASNVLTRESRWPTQISSYTRQCGGGIAGALKNSLFCTVLAVIIRYSKFQRGTRAQCTSDLVHYMLVLWVIPGLLISAILDLYP